MGKLKKTKKVPKPRNHESLSIEELARQQGVKPVTDLDEIGALMPEEFDPDAFLAWLAEERAARRRAVKE
jgi:hypothetical protein